MSDPAASYAEMTELTREVRRTFAALREAVEGLHAEIGLSGAQRAVLELLGERGPMTTPRMASDKRMTRQSMQELVNALAERGLVQSRVNPAHARSPLIGLTREGSEVLIDVLKREEGLLSPRFQNLTAPDVRRAAATLRALQSALEYPAELKIP